MADLSLAQTAANFIAPGRDWVQKNLSFLDFSDAPIMLPEWFPGLNVITSFVAGTLFTAGIGQDNRIAACGLGLSSWSILTTSKKSNQAELAEEITAFAAGAILGSVINIGMRCTLSAGRVQQSPKKAE